MFPKLRRMAISALTALGMALGAGAPAFASAPGIAASAPSTASGPAENVQDRRGWDGRESGRRDYRPGRDNRHRDWRPRHREWGPPRHYRPPAYRYGPRSGIELRIVPPYVSPAPRYYRTTPRVRQSTAHVRWCHSRYRSYRAWDNSWQPNYGPRRQCRSPYA